MGIFGFSTDTASGGDFLPILKYDARAGRFFRMDRVDAGQGFETVATDITGTFKAVIDLDNVEVGWALFMPGVAPSFALVPMGQQLPERPSPEHRNGVRFLLKLAKSCSAGDGKDIREVAGTSKAFLSGIEALYLEYQKEKPKHVGKLPAVSLVKTVPIKTGSGQNSSTNYTPVFKIEGWVPRGDLAPHPRTNGSGQPSMENFRNVAPSTGGTQRAAPAQAATVTNIADEF